MKTYFIWGMGLLGTSLALDLKKLGHIVTGCVRSVENLIALEKYNLDDFCLVSDNKLVSLISQADGIIIATPVNAIPLILKQINEYTLKKNLWVIDMASTKSQLMAEVDSIHLKYPFIATHPMAGSDLAGPQNAIHNLFVRATVYITKSLSNEQEMGNSRYQEAIQEVEILWNSVQAKPKYITAKEHDLIAAYLSHGPHLIACASALLTKNVPSIFTMDNPAGGSFRDITRVAQSLPSLWKEIIDSNSDETILYLEEMVLLLNTWIQQMKDQTIHIDAIFKESKIVRDTIIKPL